MQEMISFLQKNAMGSLATVADGKPKVRPWGFMFFDEGKFYFTTSNKKEVFQQLKEVPFAEFTSCDPTTMASVRVCGEVVFVDDIKMKEKVFELNPALAQMYGNPQNPDFEVFYLQKGELKYTDFSGNPPKVISY